MYTCPSCAARSWVWPGSHHHHQPHLFSHFQEEVSEHLPTTNSSRERLFPSFPLAKSFGQT